jgi:NAD(P)H dehydrogenase (quinone)
MKVLVVLGHPKTGSFNHALAATAVQALKANSHEVSFHDLYAEGFDPVLTQAEFEETEVSDPVIATQCAEVGSAGGFVVIHPNWWAQPPAIVTGWTDRVLRYGLAYAFEERDGKEVEVGLLAGRKALVINTCMTPAEADQGPYADPIGNLWKNCVFGLCGITDFDRLYLRMVQTVSQQEREGMLSDVTAAVDRMFPRG